MIEINESVQTTEISFPKLKKKKKKKNETNNNFKKEENSNVSLVSINQVVKNSHNLLHSGWTIKQALSRGETCLKGIIDPK